MKTASKQLMNDSILVPVDFSRPSKAALRTAAEMAEAMKKPLVILHVVHDPADMPGYYARAAKSKHLLRIEDLAQTMFDDFVKSMRKKNPGLKALKTAETVLVKGLPVARILEVAEKIGAAMIVMGSQGRTGLSQIILGSKAEQVIRLSPIPVTIVKQAARAGESL